VGAGHCRPGGLFGSPFNVKWRFSAPAGLAAKALSSPSSISTGFYFQSTFCSSPSSVLSPNLNRVKVKVNSQATFHNVKNFFCLHPQLFFLLMLLNKYPSI
jgi:hypothetical protein